MCRAVMQQQAVATMTQSTAEVLLDEKKAIFQWLSGRLSSAQHARIMSSLRTSVRNTNLNLGVESELTARLDGSQRRHTSSVNSDVRLSTRATKVHLCVRSSEASKESGNFCVQRRKSCMKPLWATEAKTQERRPAEKKN